MHVSTVFSISLRQGTVSEYRIGGGTPCLRVDVRDA